VKSFLEEELKIYHQEEIPAQLLEKMAVDCPDNKRTIELQKKMTEILNEASNRNPMPNLREKFVQEDLQALFGDSKRLRKAEGKFQNKAAPFDLTSYRDHFVVNHYAGSVEYRYEDMLERNNDKLLESLKSAVQQSDSKFVRSLFSDEEKIGKLRRQSGKSLNSLIKTFSKSLNSLIKKLNSAQPHYVRCLKPNDLKLPRLFQTSMVLDQMNCSGLFEAVKIRKSGFPFRVPIANFIKNFGPSVLDSKEIKQILEVQDGEDATKEKAFRSNAQSVIDLISSRTKDPWLDYANGNVFVGKNNVLMRTGYWTQLSAFRQEIMKEIFIEAINSKSIVKLEAAVSKAKELDMHFAEAVSATRLLEFIRREDYCISTEIPNLLRLSDLEFFISQRDGLKEALQVNMAPISDIIHANTLESYFQTGGKKLEAAWKKLKDHENVLRECNEYAKRLAKAIHKDGKGQMVATFHMIPDLESLVKEGEALPPHLKSTVRKDISSAKRLILYLTSCKGLINKLNKISEKAIDLIDDVVEKPEDSRLVKQAEVTLLTVEKMLQSLAAEPLSNTLSLRELDDTCVAITKEIGYSKIRLNCVKHINTMLREEKMFLTKDTIDSKAPESALHETLLKMKVDLDELRGLDKLDEDLNQAAIHALQKWAVAYIEFGARKSLDGDGVKIIRDVKQLLQNLNLPSDFKVSNLLRVADQKLGPLESKAKEKEDASEQENDYVLSPRRRGNKTLPTRMTRTRTTSQLIGNQKLEIHDNRRRHLQNKAKTLVGQLVPIQRELELTISRLDEIEEEEGGDVVIYKKRSHLPMSRVYQRALKNALDDGDLPDVADIFGHLKLIQASIPQSLSAPGEIVSSNLMQASSPTEIEVAIQKSYRELVHYYRNEGDERMTRKYLEFFRYQRTE